MKHVKPVDSLQQLAAAIPEFCRKNVVIIGSLAAGYAFASKYPQIAVRTKDIDCLLRPFDLAVEKGEAITRQLLDEGWQRVDIGAHSTPGDAQTPDDLLPAVRLYPPGLGPDGESSWFIELLTVPESTSESGRKWTRIVLDEGHFGLPSFRFLGVTAFNPVYVEELGIHVARPEMMALANLLEHSEIGQERMSALFSGRSIKRSNKDLGRVLAITFLANLDDYRIWAYEWNNALQSCFPDKRQELALRTGAGLQALLDSDEDLEEAHYTCINGLLAGQPVSIEILREAGERVMGEAVLLLRELAGL